MRSTGFILLFLVLFKGSICSAQQTGKLAIVLDDIGYSLNDFEALSLPNEIAFSILPFTPQGKKIANLAHQQGREILLHVPMQAKNNNIKLGEGALTSGMDEAELKKTLKKSLQYLPYAQGINNHMGSELTEHATPMRWVMEVLLEKGLYFIDSRTSAQTVAESIAKRLGVPTLRRHVFLDNIKTEEAMNHQFQRALHLTKLNKHVIIIAHPYPETLAFLKLKSEILTTENRLTSLTRLIPRSQRLVMVQNKLAFQHSDSLKSSNNLSPVQ